MSLVVGDLVSFMATLDGPRVAGTWTIVQNRTTRSAPCDFDPETKRWKPRKGKIRKHSAYTLERAGVRRTAADENIYKGVDPVELMPASVADIQQALPGLCALISQQENEENGDAWSHWSMIRLVPGTKPHWQRLVIDLMFHEWSPLSAETDQPKRKCGGGRSRKRGKPTVRNADFWLTAQCVIRYLLTLPQGHARAPDRSLLLDLVGALEGEGEMRRAIQCEVLDALKIRP